MTWQPDLTGDETGRCHRCEHGDDDAIEVQRNTEGPSA